MKRFVLVALTVITVLSIQTLFAQTWSVPCTPWGDPDLQGIWPGSHDGRTHRAAAAASPALREVGGLAAVVLNSDGPVTGVSAASRRRSRR